MGPVTTKELAIRTPRLTILALLLIILAGGASLRAQDPARPPTPEGVAVALDRGVQWLLGLQEVDGSWRGQQVDLYNGGTALVLYTLLKCGLAPDHPAVRAGFAWLDRRPLERVYDLGCALMAYEALGETRPVERVEKLARRLSASMGNGRRAMGGRWGYPNNHRGGNYRHTDLSNTQYAVLGLRAARGCGVEAMAPTGWARVARDLLDEQDAYGGWGYTTGARPSASMTAAGIGILAICLEALGEQADAGLQSKIQVGIRGGLRWFQKNWAVDHNIDFRQKSKRNDRWLFYYLYGLERIGAFLEREELAGHFWHVEGSAEILKRQKKDGHWPEGDADTCFCLLFLRRGSRSSGLGPRARAAEEAARGRPLSIGMDHANPVTAWVRSLGADLRREIAEGAAIAGLQWLVEGEVREVVAVASQDALLAERCFLRHEARQNGVHRIQARLRILPSGGGEERLIESNVLELRVDDVEEPWQREAIRDLSRSLVEPEGGIATASSSLGGRKPGDALDGKGATSWICDEKDPDPWISVALGSGVRANVLKLSSASAYEKSGNYVARPRDIELRLNGRESLYLRLEDTVRRKQWVVFPRKTVRSLRVRIRSVYGGSGYRHAAGFKAIELFNEETLDLAEVGARPQAMQLLLPPARYEPTAWRYTLEDPGPGWETEALRDLSWKRGKAGFGSEASTYCPWKTLWKTPEIWIRREFKLPRGDPGELRIDINHDDDARVFINGVFAAEAPGWSHRGYRSLSLRPAARAALREGRNLIAVHCKNASGPGYLDVSLVRLLGR